MTTHKLEPAAPWEQLGITEEEFNQKQEKANALAHMLKKEFGDPIQPQQPASIAAELHAIREQTKDLPPVETPAPTSPSKPARKPRSDKGTGRVPKTQTLSIEAVSAMTADQAQDLIRLVASRTEALKVWEEAKRDTEVCGEEFKQSAKSLQDFIAALAVDK